MKTQSGDESEPMDTRQAIATLIDEKKRRIRDLAYFNAVDEGTLKALPDRMRERTIEADKLRREIVALAMDGVPEPTYVPGARPY